MNMNVRELSASDEAKWDLFVDRNANSTLYHKLSWKRAIEKTYEHRPYYLFSEDASGEITGILPLFFIKSIFFGKRLVSLPFAPYGGVCSDDDGARMSLVDEAVRLSERLGANYCEIRSVNDKDYYNGFSHANQYSDFTMDISYGIEHIWSYIGHQKRNRIKKAEKNELEFRIGGTRELIDEFYGVYSWGMKYLGTPVHSRSLFLNLFEEFRGDVLVSEVRMGEEVVAVDYMIKYKDGISSLWGSNLRDYLKFGSSDYSIWKCLEHGCMNKLSWFSLGRSLTNSSFYSYKKHWGFVDKPIFNHYYPSSIAISIPQDEYAAISNLWKRLPLDTTRLIGPVIRKYII